MNVNDELKKLSQHELDLISLFRNFLERNNLPKLIIISLKNSFFSNSVPMELNEVMKAQKEFDIFDKSFIPLLKANHNLAGEILSFYEHMALLFYYRNNYDTCYGALKHSLVFLEKYCPKESFISSKLKNTYNKIECLSKMLGSKIFVEELTKCKEFLNTYDLTSITEFLERLLFHYYRAVVSLLQNNLGEIGQSIKKFNQELDSWNNINKGKEPNPKIEEVKDYLELKVRLLAIKIYEKRSPIPYNDILVMCDTIRNKYKEINHDFFIKLNVKIADNFYYCSNYFLTNKSIAFINNFLNDLILYPKISKIRFKVLTYSKLLASSLIIGNYQHFGEILKKVTVNFERMKKFNIQASKRTLSFIEMSFLNNIALHKYYVNFPVVEAEKTLQMAKEINNNGNDLDLNTNFAIDNNIACFNFLKGNHEFALQSWKKVYYDLVKNPQSENFYFVLSNLAICTKTMQSRGTYSSSKDDSDFVLNKFKEVSKFLYSNPDYTIKTIGEVKNLVIIYNYIYFAITSNSINLSQVSLDILDHLINVIKIAYKMQGNDENTYNIWRSNPDLVLKMLYVHGLLLFYKNEYIEALDVLKQIDEISKVINLDTDYNLVNNVKIIKLRADILFKLKNYSECINEYRIVLTIYDSKLNLSNSEKKATVLCNLAQALVFQSCFDSAREYLLIAETLLNRNSGENKIKLDKVKVMLQILT